MQDKQLREIISLVRYVAIAKPPVMQHHISIESTVQFQQ